MFASPPLVYTVLWVTVIWLADLQLTKQLLPMNRATLLLVGANIVSFWAIFAVMAFFMRRKPDVATARANGIDFPCLRHFLARLAVAWAVGSVVEIVVAGGLPVLWLLAGDTTRDYRDFGIPSVHGFLTAIYLFLLSGTFLDYCVNRRRKDLLIVLGLLVWTLLQINRGAFIWSLLEMLAVFVLTRRITAVRVAQVGAALLVGILVFGQVGDWRAGAGRFAVREIASDKGQFLVDDLHPGFLWVYLYITSPINNVVGAIDRIQPVYRPYYSMATLLPTVLRQRIYDIGDDRYALGLVNQAFNTSTWYVNWLADFGIEGSILVVCGLQILMSYFYLQARRGWAWGVLVYAALFQALALSIFTDTVTSLVTIAQVVIGLVYRRSVGRWLVAASAQSSAWPVPPSSATVPQE